MANVLLGVTGSVAAIRTPLIVDELTRAGHQVRVVATDAALYFFESTKLPVDCLIRDSDEWPGDAYRRNDPVVHIELRRWADIFVIAPLDANTLGKLAAGMADNCLTCVYRAWDPAKPVLLAPAMNTFMWDHPATARNLRQIAEDSGCQVAGADPDVICCDINGSGKQMRMVGPISKRLACGDVGAGAMAEVDEIVRAVQTSLSNGIRA